MSNTVHLSAFTDTKIFMVQPRELKLTRKYEDAEYAFVASDIQLTCIDAQDLYDAVNASEDVSFVVYRDQLPCFRGKFQAEGTKYDPEKEEYTFTVLHIVKSIFDGAKDRLEINPGGKTYSSDSELRAALGAFDSVTENSLHGSGICNVRLNPADFEFANAAGKWNDAYFDFLQDNKNYTLRQYWIDFAQHYRSVMYADDDLDADGSSILHVMPRRKIQPLHTGYDDLIADYSEERKNPDYEAVIFPFKLLVLLPTGEYVGGNPVYKYAPSYCYGEYRNGKVTPWAYPIAADRANTEGAIDLRVPGAMYKTSADAAKADLDALYSSTDSFKDLAFFPFKSVPCFSGQLGTGRIMTWNTETPDDYAKRTFAGSVLPYKEVTILYSDPVEAYPLEEIAVRGTIIKIQEVEDDLMNDTTKVVGRLYL
jgi:hypothetical protein